MKKTIECKEVLTSVGNAVGALDGRRVGTFVGGRGSVGLGVASQFVTQGCDAQHKSAV